MAEAVIGLDVGTTAVKAGVYAIDGAEIAVTRRDHPLRTPRPGWAEQDPGEVVEATVGALAAAAGSAREHGAAVLGIGVSAPMHGLLGLDADRRPVTPLITWADTRALAQAAYLRAAHLDVYRRTGTPLHPMAPLAKLRWFHEQDRARARRVDRWVSAKELLLDALTGDAVIDRASASATGLYALATERWDDEALGLAGVDAEQLAPVVPTDRVLGGLTRATAERAGLPADTPVVAGATDGVLANVGVGALGGDVGALTIGTSGALRVVVDAPTTDQRMRTFCYALTADRWVVGGAISNGGLWLRWLRDKVLPDDLDDAALSALAEQVAAGSDGVTVLPYLTGERAPQWSPAAAGVVFGLRLSHGRGHLVRSGMEGVAHQLRLVRAALADGGHTVAALRATGGFTRSSVWPQIVADVLDVRVEIPVAAEAAARGAAALGMAALGLLDDVGRLPDAGVRAVHEPNAGVRATYDVAHQRYTHLVALLAEPFGDLDADRRDSGDR